MSTQRGDRKQQIDRMKNEPRGAETHRCESPAVANCRMQSRAGSRRHCRCRPVPLIANTLFYRGYVRDPGRPASPCCRTALRNVSRHQWAEAASGADKAGRLDVAVLGHNLLADVGHSGHTLRTQAVSSGRHGLMSAKPSCSHRTIVRRHNSDQLWHSSQ